MSEHGGRGSRARWSHVFRRQWAAGVGVAVCLAAVGCGRPAGVVSTGTVTLDGKPVSTGAIVFKPEDKSVAAEGSMIEAGRFRIVGKPGKRRVEISASAPAPGTPDPPTGPVQFVEIVPPRYNTKSTLTVEVKEPGPNTFTFELESSVKR